MSSYVFLRNIDDRVFSRKHLVPQSVSVVEIWRHVHHQVSVLCGGGVAVGFREQSSIFRDIVVCATWQFAMRSSGFSSVPGRSCLRVWSSIRASGEDILHEENDTESAMMTFLGKEQFHVDVLYHVVSSEVESS